MTFDDDYIQLRLLVGPLRATCKSLGLDWPPPDVIEIADIDGVYVGKSPAPTRFKRIRFSQITDEQREGMTHVCRGAEYVHAEPQQ